MADENPAQASGPSTGAASSGNVTSGTASEALIKAASASSTETAPAGAAGDTTPAAGTGTPGATAATTAQPTVDGSAATPAANRGPVPLDRHEAVVRNTREKVHAEYAWAKGIQPSERASVRSGLDLLGELRTNPRDFYDRLGKELGVAAKPAKEEAPEELPEPDLQTQDGRQKAYSAEAMQRLLKLTEQRVLATFEGRVKPLQDFHQSQQRQAEVTRVTNEATKVTSQALSAARQLPHFKEHEVEIGERLRDMDDEALKQMGPIGAMYYAYNQILSEKVFPTYDATAEARVRESNAKKVAASRGTVHPGNSGGEGQARPLNGVGDLAKHMESLEASLSR